MAKPKKQGARNRVVTAKVSIEEQDRLKDIASRNNMPLGALIYECIRRFLEVYESEH